jgi:uroporphyrin-III C-methyltransferase
MSVGTVYLVGAGPGDPELITVKALRLLRQADVVVYDRLIPMALLDEVRAGAELIDVGKRPKNHRVPQKETNRIIVDRALRGLTVVRLKGGDPFVFGRGGEEGLACHAAGVPFEVVPGVTSAIAVPAYAGVPVTHRDVVTAFTVFTGHDDPDKPDTGIDYPALAAVARTGTLVLLMGVTYLPKTCDRLVAAGLDPNTPALCIESGTMPDQRVIEGTLGTIAQRAAGANVQPPAMTVLGAVVNLRAAGLDWYRAGD